MKKFLIFFMAIISFIAIGVDVWYVYMLNTAPDKIVSQTFNIGYQQITKADGTTEKKPFIELNLYDNVFEVVFNYVRDEDQDAFYSKGVQYVANSDKGLDFSLIYSNRTGFDKRSESGWSKGWPIQEKTIGYSFLYQNSDFKYLNSFQYASGDGFKTTLNNDMANPLDQDTLFKIQLGDEENKKLYGMKLKGDRTYYNYYYSFDNMDLKKEAKNNLDATFKVDYYEQVSTQTYLVLNKHTYSCYSGYASLDLNYFSTVLYNSIRGVEKGTSQDIVFNFGDYFDYYEYDGSSYSKVSVDGDNYNKIVKDIQSYYIIRVNVHDGDMTKSSESLMGMLNGSANINPDAETGSYLYGKTIVKAEFNENIRDFELIATEDVCVYKFALKTDFKFYYDSYINEIIIQVEIDTDYLDKCGITFGGFEANTFGEFKVQGVEEYA